MRADPPGGAGVSDTTPGRALLLLHTGTTSRAELTRQLGLTRTGGAKVLAELAGAGLIDIDARPRPSGSPGRPSHLIRPAATAPLVLAASIAADAITVALVALGGTVVRSTSEELPQVVTPDDAARLVSELAAPLMKGECRPLCGAGVAIASAVDDQGRALAALYLGWEEPVPLRAIVEEALKGIGIHIPVVVHNDADCAALAEHRHGAGRGARHLLYVTSGPRGVGGALVTDGHPYRGHSGTGTELGHLSVNPGGRVCRCGNRGCLNVEVDATALVYPAGVDVDVPRTAFGRGLEAAARRVIGFARSQPVAREAVERVTDHLATALASLTNILNPDLVVLGGLLGEILRSDDTTLVELVRTRTLLHAAPMTAAKLGESTLLGAAEYALDPLLRDPMADLA